MSKQNNDGRTRVRIKCGYGRTDGLMSCGRTEIINSCETCFPSHIRILSQRIKCGYDIENAFRAIPSHICILSQKIKCGYGIESAFPAIPSHIRILSQKIKCGYGIENAFRAIPSNIRILSQKNKMWIWYRKRVLSHSKSCRILSQRIFQAISTFPNASRKTKLSCGAARSNCNKRQVLVHA